MMGYYILIGAIALVSWLVSSRLKSKFKHYSKVHLQNGMSGAEIAEKMLADHGIRDVKVVSTPGMLSDHYNPKNKTVNLSEGVYNQRNAAAAAVAAHEVGHAVQHAQAYEWLTMRSKLVPVVSVTSGMSTWVVFGGLALGAAAGVGFGYWVAVAGLIMMGMATLFSFITLPVEYDASNRALAWLKNRNMVTQSEYAGSEDALKWAARTYLVAAIGSLATLVYWGLQVFGGRD
ncbi:MULTISPECIES: zinc metallopeptidase [Maribacter]|uniref:Zinc metallopeptidase n=1 Tax=Maribacter flavus TaxID=1658664 RepID=A0A5B2TZ79_9FLAO|nr:MULTISPECIES: zinc metallopeptidase [Maribacter]KAA2219577.1 zinc metallopeptidase [Maribacter flavus]MDC6404532.1 zinc metallopeptidase [Maribacter sp. PR66]MEE1971675.1 zinc metallopeptidase [Maribacter flavus]